MLFFKWFLLSYSILGLFWFCLVVLHQSWQRPFSRRAVNPEPISFLDSDSDYVPTLPGSEVFGTRYYRHARHPSPEGLAEVCPWSIYSSVNIVLVGVDFCLFFTYHTLSREPYFLSWDNWHRLILIVWDIFIICYFN